MRSGTTPLVLLGCTFACLQWLRWLEVPGVDQSLFVAYGRWLGRGLVLYRDLWDSKPPGLFWAYAIAERVMGTGPAPRLLDAAAAVASAVLAYLLLRSVLRDAASSAARRAPVSSAVAPWVGAFMTAFLPADPCFGLLRTAAQPEVLSTPLVLAAVLLVRRGGARAVFLGGALLGMAALSKLALALLLPLGWVCAPPAMRRRRNHALALLAGAGLVLLGCAASLLAQRTFAEALRAVILYPRAYGAELAHRIALAPALWRASVGLGHGIPLALALAAAGVAGSPRSPFVRACLVWLVLSGTAVVLQRQLVDYQLALLLPPLALLGALGAGTVARWGTSILATWRSRGTGGRRMDRTRALIVATALGGSLALLIGVEIESWGRGYAAHAACRGGRMSREEFVLRLGRPGLMWQEALAVRTILGSHPASPRESILVWGFAPAIYAVADRPPATPYAFHQTLLVEGSALATRWPSAAARRAALLERLQQDPPRFVVVVSGDRSGLEPRDSRAELADFPELAAWLTTHCTPIGSTRSYEVLRRTGDSD